MKFPRRIGKRTGLLGRILTAAAMLALGGLIYLYVTGRDLASRAEAQRVRDAEIARMQAQVEALEARVESARAQVKAMEDDELEIEASIRKVGNGARPGEIVYHLDGFPEDQTPATGVAEAGTTWQRTN
jgi:cell division protein FtsB